MYNFKDKYLKYKQKYLNKKNKGGGSVNSLNNNLMVLKFNGGAISEDLGVHITHSDILSKIYGKNPEKIDLKQAHYCPDAYPFLCNINSKAMGLCRESPQMCNRTLITGKDNIVPTSYITPDENIEAKIFNYDSDNFGRSCNKWHLLYEKKFQKPIPLPNDVSIMTMNIWGLSVNNMVKYSFMDQRMNKISEIINDNNPDIVCLQEMSYNSFILLNPHISNNYKRSEDVFLSDDEIKKQRNRDIDLFAYLKYEPIRIQIYSVGGVLNFEYGVMIIEYSNVIIFNVYLQSGSGYSPGQEGEFNTIHYSRCRREQYETLKTKINEYPDKKIIVCGDFNIHLDGDHQEWPEKKELDSINLIDTYRSLNTDHGFTEDTKINTMRFNIKFKDKQFRFDSIFVKNIRPIESLLVGTKSFDLNDSQLQILKEYLIGIGKGDKFHLIRYKPNSKIVEWWPSDHFGILTKLSLT